MKTTLLPFLTALILTVATQSYAQFNWDSNGDTPSTTEFLGVDATGTNPMVIQTTPALDINFHVNALQRMRLVGLNNIGVAGSSNFGYLGVGLTTMPLARLHLGQNCNAYNGWRPWMIEGTFTCAGGDNMYVGMKQSEDNAGTNRQDGVLCWGDDGGGGGGPDLFRILFIAGAPAGGPAQGLEVSRYLPNGNVGIGDFSSTGNGGTALFPVNRLDVYGNQSIGNAYAADATSLAPANGLLVEGFTGMGSTFTNTDVPARQLDIVDGLNPQLRLTHDFVGTSTYTEFTATSLGDLLIHPINSAGTARRVGINVPSAGTPFSTLDVNGRANVRVVDQDNTLTKVLMWNDGSLGRLEWRDAATLGGVASATNAAWINSSSEVEWGTNPLDHDTEIPMKDGNGDDWSIYFSGQSSMDNALNTASIGVGHTFGTGLDGKFDVRSFTTTGATFDHINFNAGKFFTEGDYTGPPNGYIFTGVHGNCEIQSSVLRTTSIGGDFYASRNRRINIGTQGSALIPNATNQSLVWSENIGVRGEAIQEECVSYGRSYGVVGTGTGGEYAYGVRGIGMRGFRMSIGVYGGIGTSDDPNVCPGDDWGVYCAGPLQSTAGIFRPSDAMLKQNIETLSAEAAFDILNQLNPSTYNYDTVTFSTMALPSGPQVGLMAQEVAQVLPNAVRTAIQPAEYDSLGTLLHEEVEYKSVDYMTMIPILVAAVNDLQNQVQELQNCCAQNGITPNTPDQNGNDGTNIQDHGNQSRIVELSNYAVILDQNSPNPFAEKTTITYTIPVDVKDAQLIFSDDNGRILKTVQIIERGQGSILVYASNLSTGTYTYSLIADGKLIDTKKMVCQK